MASDNFLKIDGVEGESTDDKHQKWIEVLSYNIGLSQTASAAARSATGGAASHRADFQDLSIVKHVDKASPMIAKLCAKGETVPNVTLECCRAGGDKQLYLMYKLEQVIISSVNLGGGGGGEATESVTFNYGKITQEYTPIGRDGKPQGKIPFGWNLEANKPV